MEATSITQTTNTIIELITQPLSEKIKEAGSQIHDSLVHGMINTATETIRKLVVWFEELVWESYVTSFLQCEIFLLWLRALGAQKGLRLVSYQKIWITLPTGTKVQIRSPFFVKASPKRGPQNRGQHLFLSLMGFVHKVEPGLAFRAVQLAVMAPSFDTASKIFALKGITLSPNKIRQMVTEMAPDDSIIRVERLLGDNEDRPLENQRVLLCVDGGRLRQRKNKRGSRPEGAKRCGYHTDWIEPKLFTIYLIDEKGDIIKRVPPFVDGTTGKLKEFLELLRYYLTRLGIKEASEVVLVADGASWIWERIPHLLKETGVDNRKITEIIDWTHAKQNLDKAFSTLSKTKIGKVNFNYFKELLFSGKITKIVSAIRRVINMRVKSPGSFWKLGYAETVMYLRAQLLYGRWKNLTVNWTKSIISDFQTISITVANHA